MSVQTRYNGSTVFDHWLVGSYLGCSANHQTAVFVLTHRSCEWLHCALKAVNLITREGSPSECTSIQRAKYQSELEKGKIVFAHWKVEKHLGSGSNGKTAVFVLSHANSGEICSALKAVNLISEEGTLEECTPFQKNEYLSAREGRTKAAIQEVILMSGLQGQPNIVGYLDHAIVDWQEDGCFGRDLLIRMELLTDLRRLMLQGKIFSEAEVIRIGTDICAALSVCHQKNILHRDIKPENIFVSGDGVYKLGDFGISRILDSAPDSRASTGIGTPRYAAPEQFSLKYDKRADLYSLGLVLYELRNGNRLPFTAAQSSMPEYVRRRLSGAAFPELKSTSPELSSAIFRAFAYGIFKKSPYNYLHYNYAAHCFLIRCMLYFIYYERFK